MLEDVDFVFSAGRLISRGDDISTLQFNEFAFGSQYQYTQSLAGSMPKCSACASGPPVIDGRLFLVSVAAPIAYFIASEVLNPIEISNFLSSVAAAWQWAAFALKLKMRCRRLSFYLWNGYSDGLISKGSIPVRRSGA